MTHEELLLKLRDIEAPPEPPWWLLAPAWFWLAGALCCALGATWWWVRRRRTQRLARIAAAELRAIHLEYRRNGDSRQLAHRVASWLRQVALLAYPERQLQRACGDTWLQFLEQDLPGQPFSQGCGRVFGHPLYQRNVDLDADQVIALCERWLRSIRPRLQQYGVAQ